MKSRAFGRGCGALIAAVGLVFTVVGLAPIIGDESQGWLLLGVAPWFLVGAFVVSVRPGNVMGWLFAAVGLLWASGTVAGALAEQSGLLNTTLHAWLSWYASWYWIAAIGLQLVTLMLFPTGRALSPGWRPALFVVSAGLAVAVGRMALASSVQATRDAPVFANPIGLDALSGVQQADEGPILAFLLISALVALASFIVRFRRSRGVERQQLKWMALAAPILVLGWMAGGVFEAVPALSALSYLVASLAVPLAAGMAISRSRLYDIDRIISRTTSYALVTGAMVVVYVVAVTSASRLFPDADSLGVAAATLLAAAVFRPLFTRVQRVVDRRFDREQYNAEQAAEQFAARLRDEVDPEAVTSQLLDVVQQSLQPAAVGVVMVGRAT
jgi:hypothetical protein